MRGIYLSDGGRPIRAWHSHACTGEQHPLCKFNKQNTSQKFLRWEYEQSEYFTCPACRKLAASRQWVRGAI